MSSSATSHETHYSCQMQRTLSITTRIHIHAFVQFRLNTRKVAFLGSIVNRVSEGCRDQ